MKCEEVRECLPLFLYSELQFDQEDEFESHLSDCAACRDALASEKALHSLINGAERPPSRQFLAECRQQLSERIATERQSARGPWWAHLREMFTVRMLPFPAAVQPLGAAALLLMGFLGARLIPTSIMPGTQSASLAGPFSSRVKDVQASEPGKVQIILEDTRQRTLSGKLDDESIQKLLVSAAKDPADPGLRVESVDLLTAEPESAQVRQALLYAVEHDVNAGVRLKALDGLKRFAGEPDTRQVLTRVLLHDNNAGVRTQAIDLLVQRKEDDMVGVLQQLMHSDENGYVRMRCERALRDMNASAGTF